MESTLDELLDFFAKKITYTKVIMYYSNRIIKGIYTRKRRSFTL